MAKMPFFCLFLLIVSCFPQIAGHYPANTIKMFEQLHFKHFRFVEWCLSSGTALEASEHNIFKCILYD